MQQIKKRQIAAQAKGQDQAVDQLESKIVEQETDISNMENRNFYSLHCLQLETQLVHANMKMLAIILQKMVSSQVLGHREVRYLPAIDHHWHPCIDYWSCECECECVFIYRTYHIVSQSSLQFYLSETDGRQLVKAPLAAAIGPCLISLTHPTHA